MLDSESPFPTMAPLSHIVRVVRIRARDDLLPWMHLVRLSIAPRLRVSSPDIELYVTSSHQGDSCGIRSNRTDFYGTVPRSIPSMGPVLTGLDLNSVHFNNSADLCRLLVSYPMLRRITLENLTWTTPPTYESFYSLQLGSGAEQLVTTCKNDQELHATWFLPAVIARTEKPPRVPSRQAIQHSARLHPEDHKCLFALLGVLRGQEEPARADDTPQQWYILRPLDGGSKTRSTYWPI